MSFEGYYQILCVNGHLFEVDYMHLDYYSDEHELCPDCNTRLPKNFFHNLVDDTNYDTCDIIPDFEWEKLCIVEKDEYGLKRYRRPTEQEHAKMRNYIQTWSEEEGFKYTYVGKEEN